MWEILVSFSCPLALAWLVFMYYRFVDTWLSSLSTIGRGLAAMVAVIAVVLAVVLGYWRQSCQHASSTKVASNVGVPPLTVNVTATEQKHEENDENEVSVNGEDSQSWSLSSGSLSDRSSKSHWQLSDSRCSDSYRLSRSSGSVAIESDRWLSSSGSNDIHHHDMDDAWDDPDNDSAFSYTYTVDMDHDNAMSEGSDDYIDDINPLDDEERRRQSSDGRYFDAHNGGDIVVGDVDHVDSDGK